MTSVNTTIQEQIRLPIPVAWRIVVQGIRIRLGRSVVTLLGVVLGVAFLMSILTASLLRGRVAEEIESRRQTAAMLSFLMAETASLAGQPIAVWQQPGETDELEQRFLKEVFERGGARQVEAESLSRAEGADRPVVLLVVGDELPGELWGRVSPQLRQPVAVFTRGIKEDASGTGVLLRRPPTEEDLQQRAAEAARERVRTIWILSIAAMVTIISISNALLMSVTERFREIGTMKCLGALSSFIRQVFFLESALIGVVGGIIGSLFGLVFATVLYAFSYGWVLIFASLPVFALLGAMLVCLLGGVSASILAAIYPANFASRMLPATALRTNI